MIQSNWHRENAVVSSKKGLGKQDWRSYLRIALFSRIFPFSKVQKCTKGNIKLLLIKLDGERSDVRTSGAHMWVFVRQSPDRVLNKISLAASLAGFFFIALRSKRSALACDPGIRSGIDRERERERRWTEKERAKVSRAVVKQVRSVSIPSEA